MRIRFAKPEDKSQILALLDELISEVNKKMGSSPNHEGDEKRHALFDEMLKRDDVKIFVAEEDGTLVGLSELFIVPILRRGYYQGIIESFVITENRRGQGIGSALLSEIKKFCKDQDFKVIKVASGNELTDAHRFYEKHGAKFTEKFFRIDLQRD